MKPHKHCEVIKAWADGKTVQYRGICGETDPWVDCIGEPFFSGSFIEFRIRPETIKYRVALFSSGQSSFVHITSAEDTCKIWEKNFSFVRWLTDWIEVEV